MLLKRLALLLLALMILPSTVCAEEDAVVVEDDMVVADQDAVVADQDAVVTDEDTVVAEEGAIVADEDAAVAEEDTVVAEEDAAMGEEDADVAEEETRDSYIYLGGAFSIGIDNFDGTAGLSSSDEGFGFDFWLGYRINRYVGVEGRISHISGFDAQYEGEAIEAIDFQMFSFTGNVKVYPITGIFQPYAILGIGSADFKSYERNDTGVLVVVGGGIDIYVLDRFSVMAELDYIVTVGDVKGLYQIQAKAGIQFQF